MLPDLQNINTFEFSQKRQPDVLPILPLNDQQTEVVAGLEALGFNPHIQFIKPDNSSYAFCTRFVSSLRQIDPDCVVWITGSSVTDTKDRQIGLMHDYYMVELDLEAPTKIKRKNKTQLYGEISDTDIEIVSSTLTKEDIRATLVDLGKHNAISAPQKIEVNCNRPKDMADYLDPSKTNSQDPNYLVHRLVMSQTGVVDEESAQALQQYKQEALRQLEKDAHTLTDNTTVQSAIGHRRFKQIEHALRKGEIDEYIVQDDEPMLLMYLHGKSKQSSWQSKPAYTDKNRDSFRVEFPDLKAVRRRIEPVHDTSVPAHLAISPPFSGYTEKVHFGQLLTGLNGAVIARQLNLSHSPLSFQVTGPYWDRNSIAGKTARNIIETNVDKITKELRRFGLTGETRRDDDPQTVATLKNMLRIWEGLGLIQQTESGPLLRTGTALTLFGALQLFNHNTMSQLNELILDNIERNDSVPIFSKNESQNHAVTINGTPIYPSFSILALPYVGMNLDGSFQKTHIVTGENTANQFGIGHAIAARTLETNEVNLMPVRLVKTADGKRMTTFEGNIPYMDDLLHLVEDLAGEKKMLGEMQKRLVVSFGLLSMTSMKSERKFNNDYFAQGIQLFSQLREIFHYLKNNGGAFPTDYDEKRQETFAKFVASYEVGGATRYYRNRVLELAKKTRKQTPINELVLEYQDVTRMTWVLFGPLGSDYISNI